MKKGYTAFSDDDVLFAKITPCMENGKAALASGLAGGRGFGSTEFHVLRAHASVLPANGSTTSCAASRSDEKPSATSRALRGSSACRLRSFRKLVFLFRRWKSSAALSICSPAPKASSACAAKPSGSRRAGPGDLHRHVRRPGDESARPRQPLCAVAEVISGVAKGRNLDPGEAVELPYMRVANVKDGYTLISPR